MIDNKDVMDLEKIFDDRYVKQSMCSTIQSENSRVHADNDKRIEIMSHDFVVIKKLMWVLASTSIGSLVAAFFELILR